MTKLRCSAVHCEYNNDNHCCLSDVNIGGGKQAKTSLETCCDSFKERPTQSTNKTGVCRCPEDRLNIACSAVSCRYNNHQACVADSVKIGNATAFKQCDTECHTFCHKQSGCCN